MKDNTTQNAAIVAAITAALEPAADAPEGFPVNLRPLHAALRATEPFRDWACVRLIDDTEGTDYIRMGENDGEFFATLESAAHIPILDTTRAGHAWRQHLIDLEKEEAPLPPGQIDRYRRIAGAENVTCRDGQWFFTGDGLRLLCTAIAEGREPGNPDTARAVLEALESV